MEPPTAIWIGPKRPHTASGSMLIIRQFLRRLPEHLPVPATVWATGGIVRRGRTYNDIDIIVRERSLIPQVVMEFERIFNMRVEAGLSQLVGYEQIGRYPAILLYQDGGKVVGNIR